MEYIGSNLQRNEMEAIALTIDPVHRADTPELMASRWFDYRHMHPVQATYLFAELYKVQTRIFAESFVDIETADDARAFTPDDIFKSRDLTSMWLARGVADRIGCPYTTMLAFVQQRALERTFQRYPRPNQMYGDDVELDLAELWKSRLRTSLQYSKEERFAASRHPDPAAWPADMRAHVQFIVDQIRARPAPHDKLIGRMYREDRLSPSWTLLPFDGEALARAEVHARELNVSHY